MKTFGGVSYLCIMDSGVYNDAIKGSLIEAMRNVDFSREDILKALNGLRWALDEMTASDAFENYRKFNKK